MNLNGNVFLEVGAQRQSTKVSPHRELSVNPIGHDRCCDAFGPRTEQMIDAIDERLPAVQYVINEDDVLVLEGHEINATRDGYTQWIGFVKVHCRCVQRHVTNGL